MESNLLSKPEALITDQKLYLDNLFITASMRDDKEPTASISEMTFFQTLDTDLVDGD